MSFLKLRLVRLLSINSTFAPFDNLSLIMGKKSLLISYPIEFRSRFKALSAVVPLPKNGSKTVSSTKENILIKRWGSSKGNMAK